MVVTVVVMVAVLVVVVVVATVVEMVSAVVVASVAVVVIVVFVVVIDLVTRKCPTIPSHGLCGLISGYIERFLQAQNDFHNEASRRNSMQSSFTHTLTTVDLWQENNVSKNNMYHFLLD